MKITAISGMLLGILLWSSTCFAQPYSILQLTDNNHHDLLPLISDSGQVLWESRTDDVMTDLHYWNGSAAFLVFSDIYWPADEDAPHMNAKGLVVWDQRKLNARRLPDVYLWNGTSAVRLSDNDFSDRESQISDGGQMVWSGSDGSDLEIFLSDGISVRQLTDNEFDDHQPQVNAAGQVAWLGYDGTDTEIFLWDGTAVRQLTDNATRDFQPRINALGQVAWRGLDGDDTEIYFWNGSSVIQITENDFSDSADAESPDSLQISDAGQLLWLVGTPGGEALYYWDGSAVALLSKKTYGYVPDMNSKGEVAWCGEGASGQGIYLWNGKAAVRIGEGFSEPKINSGGRVVWHLHDGTDYEIFVWDGSSAVQITDNDYNDFYAQINAAGEIVWQGAVKPSNREIFLARPSTDQGQEQNLDEEGRGNFAIASNGVQRY
jgi:hypothetical protein